MSSHKHDLSTYPFVTIDGGAIQKILELKDGTFITGTERYGSIKRWSVNGELLRCFCKGEWYETITALMEVDENTFLSTSNSPAAGVASFKVWNKTTGECRLPIVTSHVRCLLRLRNNDSTFLCGIGKDGCCMVEMQLDNFEIVETLKHGDNMWCMCELSNGNVLSGGYGKMILEWNMKTKTVIRSFAGHKRSVSELLELKDKTILSWSSDSETVKIWKDTTGKCLRTLKHPKSVSAVVELSDGTLLTASDDKIYEWDEKGRCVLTSKVEIDSLGIISMRGLTGGSIVIGNIARTQVRKTWLTM